ncbi:ABC transporter substrate-binding protein [Salipiger pacificus]|nr:ABC transporter substrate-binding protein [Alloyangia pacifica]
MKKTITLSATLALSVSAVVVQAQEPVTVGVLVPLTGELGEFGSIVANAVELGVAEVNAAGGTACGPLRTVIADTQGSAEQAIREGNKLIDSEGAVAILGPTSGSMVALADMAVRRKTLLMTPYAGTTTLNELGGNYVYRTVSSDLGDGAASGMWMTDRGYESVAMLVQNEESTISPAQVARDRLEEAGVEITDYIIYNPGQPSYQAELISVLAHNPDAIYLAGGQESGVTVLKEAAAAGFEGEWLLTSDLAVPYTFEMVDPRILNGRAFVELAEADNSLDEYKAFAALTQEKTGAAPLPFSANTYDMVNLVALSLDLAETCTGEGINAVLRSVTEGGKKVSTYAEGKAAIAAGEDIDLEGASGPLTMDDSGTPAGSYAIWRAEDGAWALERFYPATVFE